MAMSLRKDGTFPEGKFPMSVKFRTTAFGQVLERNARGKWRNRVAEREYDAKKRASYAAAHQSRMDGLRLFQEITAIPGQPMAGIPLKASPSADAQSIEKTVEVLEELKKKGKNNLVKGYTTQFQSQLTKLAEFIQTPFRYRGRAGIDREQVKDTAQILLGYRSVSEGEINRLIKLRKQVKNNLHSNDSRKRTRDHFEEVKALAD